MLVLEYYEGEAVLFSTLWRNYWEVETSLTDRECDELEGMLMLVDTLWACQHTREAVAVHREVAKRLDTLSRHPGQHT